MSRDDDDDDLSTLNGVTGLDRDDTLLRRTLVFFGRSLIVLIPALALLGILDTHTETQTKSNATMELEVTTASVTRAGYAVPLTLTIKSKDVLDQPITVELCGDYFDRLDFQNWFPNPAAETRGENGLSYEFDPPMGTEFTMALDAKATPHIAINSTTCNISVSTSDSSLSTTFTTWRLP